MTHPVCPILCLEVVLRIPRRVEQHDYVRRGQVDAHAAGGGADEVGEDGGRGVEGPHVQLAHDAVRVAVQPQVAPSARTVLGRAVCIHSSHYCDRSIDRLID